MIEDCYGLVLCAGKSTRMGSDKSLLSYHDRPQCYHGFDMLLPLCQKVFISCNDQQIGNFDELHPLMVDKTEFAGTGPIAGLLSAFGDYPGKNIMMIGCDYPYLTEDELRRFAAACLPGPHAAAFYNVTENVFDPVLGWYSHQCAGFLRERFLAGKFSLQHFLKDVGAYEYIPLDLLSMHSIDTPLLHTDAVSKIKNKDYASR
jgi:molybdopterin-guanine dinucleotide biosynthesis protein A